jgi:hypothetical protein
LKSRRPAFYDFTSHHRHDLADALKNVRLVLVVDVGGGATDFTSFRRMLRPTARRCGVSLSVIICCSAATTWTPAARRRGAAAGRRPETQRHAMDQLCKPPARRRNHCSTTTLPSVTASRGG